MSAMVDLTTISERLRALVEADRGGVFRGVKIHHHWIRDQGTRYEKHGFTIEVGPDTNPYYVVTVSKP